ncbi:hypothetical protein VTG60DRAFT_1119 [Thermothelomyces hinnuleus]
MSNRRGRRSHRDDRDYYDNPDYYDDYEPRPRSPRKRSLSRKVLDKLESVMGPLGVDDANKARHHRPRFSSSSSRRSDDDGYYSPSPPRRRHHSRDDRALANRYYPPSSSRRYHSASPGPPKDRHRRHSRTADTSSTGHPRASERSRSRWERGLKAAVEAGAAEAFRLRHEPGPWTGSKGGRVATAAVSAAVISGAADHRNEEGHGGGGLGPLGSAVGGMIVNRLVNGPRKEVRRK